MWSGFFKESLLPASKSARGMSQHSDSPTPEATHQASGDELWFEVTEILDENDSEYLVQWAGEDPSTGKEWTPSWVSRRSRSACELLMNRSPNRIVQPVL